ncbi:carboxylating nicotinate-nucleotide diphosphorylase [Botrimarina hoheduenensis]|uniref:Probable nicotinate-nucleotide pyrophosphorylase [carboxylating] n=1 Tax=Botrimarina hoheduenensis TaxID=2528000 RepID=A0A5C5VZU5_9BACT|nr:carboxylating nicotinate-nucleotide diphosphorylase [Botrimarina hoheduenensis]TWT43311.1 Nicotinate-nucleotide pyrophosphorylase [carboxylating] [Botrimarina hoheduenensis]
MSQPFPPIAWDALLENDARQLIRLALGEDLADAGDLTTQAIVSADRRGAADVVAREAGIAAGVRIAGLVLAEAAADATWTPAVQDGTELQPGVVVGRLEGASADLLSCERTILNLMNRLCGVATLTRQYVEAIAGTKAAVCDTRKTTPGWRRLEKFAVGCGGGSNHRIGLYDAILIKDNHLAVAGEAGLTLSEAVRRARARYPQRVVEIEVDTLAQLEAILPVSPDAVSDALPDIVLLDNMSIEQLQQAVELRGRLAPGVQLEASGGVRLDTILAIATTGVERISVGALTHAARSLDLGLDWRGQD